MSSKSGKHQVPATSSIATGLASRYATALLDLALEQKKIDEVASDLKAVETMLGESADLQRLVASPVLSRGEQERAVESLAERAGLGKLVAGFLGVLAQKRRLIALEQIIRSFKELLAAHRGEVAAEVVSAVPLDAEQLATLEKSVASFVGKAVSLSASVNPALLGGVVVRVGSRMIDASLRAKLQRLELSMRGVA